MKYKILLIKGLLLKENKNEDNQYLSPIFLRPKMNGTYRLICNMQELNQNIDYHQLKMKSLQTAIQIMTKGYYRLQ